MTREEQIKQQADKYIGHSEDLGEDINITIERIAFIEGAKWADKTMIEKACRWLLKGGYFVNSNETINDFKKAMEDLK